MKPIDIKKCNSEVAIIAKDLLGYDISYLNNYCLSITPRNANGGILERFREDYYLAEVCVDSAVEAIRLEFINSTINKPFGFYVQNYEVNADNYMRYSEVPELTYDMWNVSVFKKTKVPAGTILSSKQHCSLAVSKPTSWRATFNGVANNWQNCLEFPMQGHVVQVDSKFIYLQNHQLKKLIPIDQNTLGELESELVKTDADMQNGQAPDVKYIKFLNNSNNNIRKMGKQCTIHIKS